MDTLQWFGLPSVFAGVISVCMSFSVFAWVILCFVCVSRCMCMWVSCCICVSPKSTNCWLSRVGQPSCLVDLKGFELLTQCSSRPSNNACFPQPPPNQPSNHQQPPTSPQGPTTTTTCSQLPDVQEKESDYQQTMSREPQITFLLLKINSY